MSSTLKTAPNVSQLLPANSNIEAMFQQILHAVHKSVSSRVVCLLLLLFNLENW